jgi:hypothetical protein
VIPLHLIGSQLRLDLDVLRYCCDASARDSCKRPAEENPAPQPWNSSAMTWGMEAGTVTWESDAAGTGTCTYRPRMHKFSTCSYAVSIAKRTAFRYGHRIPSAASLGSGGPTFSPHERVVTLPGPGLMLSRHTQVQQMICKRIVRRGGPRPGLRGDDAVPDRKRRQLSRRVHAERFA